MSTRRDQDNLGLAAKLNTYSGEPSISQEIQGLDITS